MTEKYDWKEPPLSLEDEKLISAYVRMGRTIDDLPYTAEFDKICEVMGVSADDSDGKHGVFKRLLTLRKQARLPRLGTFVS